METNNTTARIFPAVPDCETPAFWEKMENLIQLNDQLLALGKSDAPAALKSLQKVRQALPSMAKIGIRYPVRAS